MSSELKQNLIAARARIEAGWCKHICHDPHANAYCIAGALLIQLIPPWLEETPEHKALRAAIPDGHPKNDYSDLARFNDHRTTTKADVLALIDRAIAAA
jgi:hypothetical protein